jgi:GNAT superfamily N-acetyltransferase
MGDISIRTATSRSELEAVLEVVRRVSREALPAVDELEHVLAVEPGSAFFLAYVGDVVAGSGVRRPSSIEGCFYAIPRVLPEQRGRGAGSALYGALSKQARIAGRESLLTRVREDDESSVRFARKRGFEELARELPVVLQIAGVDDPPAAPPKGVEILSLAHRPDLARGAWKVDGEASRDIPVEGMGTRPFEEWRALYLEGPSALPEATFVAIAEGEVVGYASLFGYPGGSAEHGLTAVRRPWRGRGIATALKRSQIDWAKRAGYTEIRTANDEANAAMRGINARLGYVAEPASLLLRGPLA